MSLPSSFLSVLHARTNQMFIAHRGLSAVYTENTIQAFSEAYAIGAECVECDMQLSKDKIPVILHDETLDRTTSAVGLLQKRTSKELSIIGVPTIDELLSLLHSISQTQANSDTKHYVNIEIKIHPDTLEIAPHIESLFVVLERWQELSSSILISSFNYTAVKECKKICQQQFHDITVGTLRKEHDTRTCEEILHETKGDVIIVGKEHLLSDTLPWNSSSRHFIPQDSQTPLGVYTVNSSKDLHAINKKLSDNDFPLSKSFIFTDDVRLFI